MQKRLLGFLTAALLVCETALTAVAGNYPGEVWADPVAEGLSDDSSVSSLPGAAGENPTVKMESAGRADWSDTTGGDAEAASGGDTSDWDNVYEEEDTDAEADALTEEDSHEDVLSDESIAGKETAGDNSGITEEEELLGKASSFSADSSDDGAEIQFPIHDDPSTPGENVPLYDGYYCISLAQPDPLMMSIKGNSSVPGTNIQVGSHAVSNVRIFYFEMIENGMFRIRSLHTGLYLSSDAAGNVLLDTKADKNSQKWKIVKNGDGNFRILTSDGKSRLTAESDSVGANIRVSGKTEGIQLYCIEPAKKMIAGSMVDCTVDKQAERDYEGNVALPKITLKLYGEVLAENRDYTLQVSTGESSGTYTLQGIGDYSGSRKETFAVITYPLKEGIYRISMAGAKDSPMISIKENSGAESANVRLGTYAASNVRLFSLKKAGDGYYYICNLNSGRYLTAAGTKPGDNVCQRALKKDIAQKWKLQPHGSTYEILTARGGRHLSATKTDVPANILLRESRNAYSSWTFTPSKKYISGNIINWKCDESVTYDPASDSYKEPAIKGVLFNTTLRKGRDYTVVFHNDSGKAAGSAELTGIGDYIGTRTLTYRLDETNLCGWYKLDKTLSGKSFSIRPYGKTDKLLGGKKDEIVSAMKGEGGVLSGCSFSLSGGHYRILAWENAYCLSGGKDGRYNVTVRSCKNSDLQYWFPVKNADATWSLLNIRSGFAMTLDGDNVKLKPFRQLDTQKFILD